jgi:hypothetical protein
MRRSLFASFVVLAATAGAADPLALPPTVTASTAKEKAAVEFPSLDGPKSRRVVSEDTAAKLAAAAPKFVPPADTPAPVGAAETSPVARDSLKPRNQIIRLPRYIVEEPKLHIPKSELQVLTPKGRIEYAFERRPGLRFGPFAFLNRRIALEMLEDDLMAQRRREEADLWSLYLVKDVPEAGLLAARRP